MNYTILIAPNVGQLVMEVNEFFSKNKNYKLNGSPYSDGQHHYQCIVLKGEKELLKG